MRKLAHLGFVLAILLIPVTTAAQGFNGGILYADDFFNWNLPQGTGPANGSIAWQDPTICKVSSAGFNFVGPKVGRPLLLIDVNPAMSEIIVPTQVLIGPGGCSLNATMAHQHYTYNLRSGTAGLQEAIDYDLSQWFGSLVIATRQWTSVGGLDGMLTAATGSTSVPVIDERTNCPVPYTWSGSAYVAGPSWCSSGSPTGVSDFTSGSLPPLFVTNVTNPTTTPGLTFSLSNAPDLSFFGNVSGGTGQPGYIQFIQGPNVTLTEGVGTLTIGATGGGGGGNTTNFEHNDTLLTGLFEPNSGIQIFDLNDTTPAPDVGFESVTFKTDTATGRVSAEVPNPPIPSVPIQMQVIPPVGGQYVILYPSTIGAASGILSIDNHNFGCEISGAGGLIISGQCTRTLSGPWVDVNGQTLAQLGISTGSVTNIYVFSISNFDPGYFLDGSTVGTLQSLGCGTSGQFSVSNNSLTTAQVTSGITGLAGTDIPSVTCNENIQRNSSILTTSSPTYENVYSIGLIVYYTGTPANEPNVLKIEPWLVYDPELNTLGTDPNFPTQQIGVTISQLPAPTGIPPSSYTVLDATTPLDCSVGGASYPNNFPHTCVNEGGIWVAPANFTGIPQSSAGICPLGANGQLTNVNCNFGGAVSNAPSEVQTIALTLGAGHCTGTGTFTAGNALFVVGQTANGPPSDGTDAFTSLWNINSGEFIGYLALGITGGSTTVSFPTPSGCAGSVTELTNVPTSSAVDGSVITFTSSTVPVSKTLGPYTTSAPEDLILTAAFINGCGNGYTANIGYTSLLSGSPVGYQNVSKGAATGQGVYQATWVPACNGTRQTDYTMVAIKSANPGGGGGSVSLTSPGSTLSLSPSTITGTGTLDLNLAHANTWSATQTFSNIDDTGAASGSGLACLQIDTAGAITNTGAICGTGGGGGTNFKVLGGSALTTANLNATTPAAGSGNQNVTPQVDGSGNITLEAPFGSSSVFGLVKVDNTTISASAGVISVIGGVVGGSGTGGDYALWSGSGASTTLTNGHLSDASSLITSTEPMAINGGSNPSQLSMTAGGTLTVGSSTTAVYGVSSLGKAVISEATGAFAEICDATNNVCPSGTVTSFTASSGSWPSILVPSVATSTTTPNLSVTLATQAAHAALIGPSSGSPAAPTFRALVASDIPTLNQSTTGNAGTATALASTPTLCTTLGQYPTGILANGNATGCAYIISGQTAGYALEAATATTATGPFPIDDAITTGGFVTIHKNVQILGTGYSAVGPAPNLFSALPTCSTSEGQIAPVTDSTTNTWGATITGSGSNHVLAYCDGSNWTVAAK